MDKQRLEAFSDGVIAVIITIMVAVMWLIPDRRIEKKLIENLRSRADGHRDQ